MKIKPTCQFASGTPDQCTKVSTCKWGDHWFCDDHGRRNVPTLEPVETDNFYVNQVTEAVRQVEASDTLNRSLMTQSREKDAQILALLAELQGIKTYMRSDPITRPCDGNAQVINRIERVLSTPPPPVVPLEDVKPLVDAVRRLENANSRRDKDLAYGRLTEAKDCLSAKHPSLA